MADNAGLTDEERAELEQLRAEKEAREQASRDAAERAELERLRAQARRRAPRPRRAAGPPPPAGAPAARERGRKLMEPDEDDLRMPLGQKVVILVVAVAIVVFVAATVLG